MYKAILSAAVAFTSPLPLPDCVSLTAHSWKILEVDFLKKKIYVPDTKSAGTFYEAIAFNSFLFKIGRKDSLCVPFAANQPKLCFMCFASVKRFGQFGMN